jgi:hypothetical protein
MPRSPYLPIGMLRDMPNGEAASTYNSFLHGGVSTYCHWKAPEPIVAFDLILDPRKNYQPTGRPPGPAANDGRPNPQSVGSGVRDVPRHHTVGAAGIEPATARL